MNSIQIELLEMMKHIHKICEQKDIHYSLTGGSLIGAIRESGFISWDDDIDIMVDRENYSILREAISQDEYYVMERGPWLQHIKPISSSSEIEPYVDVFIMDHLPDEQVKAKTKIFLLRLLQGMLKEEVEYEGFSFAYRVCILVTHIMGKPFSRPFKLKLYDRVSQIGNARKTEYVSITNDSFSLLSVRHKAGIMESFIKQKFEDTELMVTQRYHDYLMTRYGADYMTPPPKEEQIGGKHANRPRVKDEKAGV